MKKKQKRHLDNIQNLLVETIEVNFKQKTL